MNVEFLWRLDDFPTKGTFVWVTYNNQPIRWAYLPAGASRIEIENAFANGYQWRKAVACQATIMTDGKIIDSWRFTLQPQLESV
jgi:hypothetical protein